jgi:broad specificity phosphatase PhoE
VLGLEGLRRIAWACETVSAVLVIDQSYDALAAGPRRMPALAGHPAVLHLRSITKDHVLAGLRADYALGPVDIMAALECARMSWPVSTVAQAAAEAAVAPAGEAHLDATIPALRREAHELWAEVRRRGLRQGRHLARLLRGVPLDAIYTSPLERARRTAEAIRRDRSVVTQSIEDLRELDYGRAQGLQVDELDRIASGLAARWRSDPWSVSFPKGESLGELQRRVWAIVEQLVRRHHGNTILLSAHGHVNRVLILCARGWARERFWTIPQPNGSCYPLHVSGVPEQ